MKRPKWSMDLRKARLERGLTQAQAAACVRCPYAVGATMRRDDISPVLSC